MPITSRLRTAIMLKVLRPSLVAACGFVVWIAAEQTASAQTLLAQSGGAKTAVGWLLVLLCLLLGLLAVCWPNKRKWPGADKK